jgi:hypothetical protein
MERSEHDESVAPDHTDSPMAFLDAPDAPPIEAPSQAPAEALVDLWPPEQQHRTHHDGARDAVPNDTSAKTVVSPDRQELHKNPEPLAEAEPGGARRPSWEAEPQEPHDVQATPDGVDVPPSRAHEMFERMMERHGKVDLTKPGAWGRWAHASIQDAVAENYPDVGVEAEKSVRVLDNDGTTGKGRIDVYAPGQQLEIKTHDIDRMTDREFGKFLEDTVAQVERYQNSPDFDEPLKSAVYLERVPKSHGRQHVVETVFTSRGIAVIWGPLGRQRS